MRRVVLAGAAGLFVAALAAAQPWGGNYTQPDVFLGTWTETYDGGGPGQPGNILGAVSSPAQWTLTGMVLQTPGAQLIGSGVDPTHGAYQEYQTSYAGGTLSVDANATAWGEAFVATGLTATNVSRSYADGYLGFTYTIGGQIGGYQDVTAVVTYLGDPTEIVTGQAIVGHYGTLQSVSIAIEVVPERGVPAAGTFGLVVLLAAVLGIGLVLIRRTTLA